MSGLTGDSPLPVVRGDWVESREYTPRVGKVVDSYWSTKADGTQVCMVDIAVYALSGNRIGRESPAEGGPRTYEPWLTYADWVRIAKPAFPLKLDWSTEPGITGGGEGRYVTDAKRIDDRVEAPRKRAKGYKPRALAKPADTDYDPELEVRTRRMAAQQLRDINREAPQPALIEKAEKLEAEAAEIAREHGMER